MKKIIYSIQKIAKASLGLMIISLALLIAVSITFMLEGKSVLDNELITKISLISILFALLPTTSQLIDLVQDKKKEFTVTGKCPRCKTNYEMTMIEKD